MAGAILITPTMTTVLIATTTPMMAMTLMRVMMVVVVFVGVFIVTVIHTVTTTRCRNIAIVAMSVVPVTVQMDDSRVDRMDDWLDVL